MKIRQITSILLISPCLAFANEEPTVRETLLNDYFVAASVCSTADITSITDDGSNITIDLQIEPNTSRGLVKLAPKVRDDWFSLHCPPEFHPVWRVEENLDDIRVRGILSDNTVELLSCKQYQAQVYQRINNAKSSVDAWLKKLLAR